MERRVGHHRGVAEHFSLSDVRRRYADRPRRELDAAIRELREEATRAGHWDVCKHDVLDVAAQRLAAGERPPALPPPPPPTESTISPAFIAWHLAEAAAYAAQAAATGVPLPTTTPVDSHLGDDDDEDDNDSCRHADSSDSDPTRFVGGDSNADEASDGEVWPHLIFWIVVWVVVKGARYASVQAQLKVCIIKRLSYTIKSREL